MLLLGLLHALLGAGVLAADLLLVILLHLVQFCMEVCALAAEVLIVGRGNIHLRLQAAQLLCALGFPGIAGFLCLLPGRVALFGQDLNALAQLLDAAGLAGRLPAARLQLLGMRPAGLVPADRPPESRQILR